VFVVVVPVAGVPVPVVHVVHVVAMLNLLVPAPGSVGVGVLLGAYMHVQDALVVVLAVCAVGVPVVQVVHMVAVLHLGMATAGAMLVLVHRVRRVIGGGGHRRPPSMSRVHINVRYSPDHDMRDLSAPQEMCNLLGLLVDPYQRLTRLS
jgi:hypothetical protein